jgi:hypothetical protein
VMVAAEAFTRAQRVTPQAMTFRDAPPRGGRRRHVGRDLPPIGGIETSIDNIDPVLEAMAQSQGRTLAELASVRLTLQLTAPDRPAVRRTLDIAVRRDPGGQTFTATCELPGPWGHGRTVGEAFRDCLEDLAERSAIIMKDRDHLGPALQREADAIARWARVTE